MISKEDGWREHAYAKDIYGVMRAEKGLKKKGWDVASIKHPTGWKIFIREKDP